MYYKKKAIQGLPKGAMGLFKTGPRVIGRFKEG
jgi:hypothetical protein